MFTLEKFLKPYGEQTVLETVSLKEIVETVNPVKIRFIPASTGANGEVPQRIHLVPKDETKRVSIRVSPKLGVTVDEKNCLEVLKNNTLYYGESDNGGWITLGPKAGAGVKEVSFASLFAGGKVTVS